MVVVLVLLVMDDGNHSGSNGCLWVGVGVSMSMWGMARIMVLAMIWVLSIWLVLILATEEGHGAGLSGGESGIGVLISCGSGV